MPGLGDVAPTLKTVIVLFHPNDDTIDAMQSLIDSGYDPILVVNAASDRAIARIQALRGAAIIINEANRGLAYAFNQGIGYALANDASYVLLLDQDSRPDNGLGRRLVSQAETYRRTGGRLAAIGPIPIDRKRPEARMVALDAAPGEDLVEVPTIISSGMTIPRAALEMVGGMWNELFIDQLDHEWCFRARAAGLKVLLDTGCPMAHDMGDAGFTLFGAYKPVHRSAVRHFHIIRNSLWLARCSAIPPRWRAREVIKLLIRMPAYFALSSDRTATLKAMLRAVRDGLGPLEAPTYRA